jgi:hypothetical protein
VVGRVTDELVEVELLGEGLGDGWSDTSTVERDPGNWWKWLLGFVGVVAAIGLGSWVLDSDDPDASATPTTLTEEQQSPDLFEEADELEPDPAGSALGQGTPVVGSVDRTQVGPPGIPSGTVLVGHGPGMALVAIDSDGAVTQLLGEDSRRFLPQQTSGGSIVGTFTFTGGWIVVGADGRTNRAEVEDGDAPLFLPGAVAGTYVVHNVRTGEVVYADAAGSTTGRGPSLLRGTRLVGASRAGLVVVGLDDRASLIDGQTGALLRSLEGLPLLVGGERYVVTSCVAASSCEVAVTSMDGSQRLVLPVDADRADRVIMRLSTSGSAVALRSGGDLVVLDTDTGAELLRHRGRALGGVQFLGDEHLLVWEPGGEVVVGDLASGEVTTVDTADLIDTGLRGVALLRRP